MSRVKVVNKTDEQRKAEWLSGKCPYCGSDHIFETPIFKKIRGYDKPVVGKEYRCLTCDNSNQFTEKI